MKDAQLGRRMQEYERQWIELAAVLLNLGKDNEFQIQINRQSDEETAKVVPI